jgi:hypothetical protein
VVFLRVPGRPAPANVRFRSGLTAAGRRPMRPASSRPVLARTFATRLARFWPTRVLAGLGLPHGPLQEHHTALVDGAAAADLDRPDVDPDRERRERVAVEGRARGEAPLRGGVVFLRVPGRPAPATVRSRSGLTTAGRRPMRPAASHPVLARTFAPRSLLIRLACSLVSACLTARSRNTTPPGDGAATADPDLPDVDPDRERRRGDA